MHLNNDYKDADGNRIIGKAVKCKKMISILKKIPMNYLLSPSQLTGNIIVMNEHAVDVGFIDIAGDKYEKYDF